MADRNQILMMLEAEFGILREDGEYLLSLHPDALAQSDAFMAVEYLSILENLTRRPKNKSIDL